MSGPTMEGSLYKMKKGMTGTTWKKNWVEVDTAQIRQFPSKGKPSAKEVPKNAFPLSECHLEVSHLRKLCFKIMHKSSSESMVLAVDDDDEYNKWFETLRKNIKSATKAALRAEATRDRGNNGPTGGATADFDDDDIDEDEYGEDGEDVDDESASEANSDEGLTDAERYEKLKLATILSFFAEHNKSKDTSNPCVTMREIGQLFQLLDASLNIDISCNILSKDLGFCFDDLLPQQTFLLWWGANSAYVEPVLSVTGIDPFASAPAPSATSGTASMRAGGAGAGVGAPGSRKSGSSGAGGGSDGVGDVGDEGNGDDDASYDAGSALDSASGSVAGGVGGSGRSPLRVPLSPSRSFTSSPMFSAAALGTSLHPFHDTGATATATGSTAESSVGAGAGAGAGAGIPVALSGGRRTASALLGDAQSVSSSAAAPAVFSASILPGIASPLANLNFFEVSAPPNGDGMSTPGGAARRLSSLDGAALASTVGLNTSVVTASKYVSASSFSIGLESEDTVHLAGFISAPAESAMDGRSAYFVRAEMPHTTALAQAYEQSDLVHPNRQRGNSRARSSSKGGSVGGASTLYSSTTGRDQIRDGVGAGARAAVTPPSPVGGGSSVVGSAGRPVDQQSRGHFDGSEEVEKAEEEEADDEEDLQALEQLSPNDADDDEEGEGEHTTPAGDDDVDEPPSDDDDSDWEGDGEENNWNQRYQDALDAALAARFDCPSTHAARAVAEAAVAEAEAALAVLGADINTDATTSGTATATGKGRNKAAAAQKKARADAEAALQNALGVLEAARAAEVGEESQAIKQVLRLCRFKAKFYAAAADGVRCIVDEYTLPDHLKTATRLSDPPPERLTDAAKAAAAAAGIVLTPAGTGTATACAVESDAASIGISSSASSGVGAMGTDGAAEGVVEDGAESTCEVFIHQGLIFHVAGTPGSELDRQRKSPGGTSGGAAIATAAAKYSRHDDRSGSGISSSEGQDKGMGGGLHGMLPQQDVERVQLMSAQDVLLHKMLGCEYRATTAVQTAIGALKTQFAVVDKWNILRATAAERKVMAGVDRAADAKVEEEAKACPSLPTLNSFCVPQSTKLLDRGISVRSVSMGPGAASGAASRGAEAPPLATVFSTLVDYCGFRVSVLCPVEMHDMITLVHGPSAVLLDDEVFVSASSQVGAALPQLAAQMNLFISSREREVVHSRLSSVGESATISSELVQLISADMQAHECEDGRLYLTSLQTLLPSDLPRFESFDSHTRQLRPEFALRVGMDSPLCSDALLAAPPTGMLDELGEDDNSAPGDEGGGGEGDQPTISAKGRRGSVIKEVSNVKSNKARRASVSVASVTSDGMELSPQEEEWLQNSLSNINTCAELYKKVLPYIASVLDSCCDMPIDSLGLAQLLHHQGANCRHIGVLYGLCRTPWARHLLLGEAVARAFKVVSSTLLRSQARAARAEALCAVHRGRSHADDFFDFMDHCVERRNELILSTFNLALGCGDASAAFWEGSICPALQEKFGIKSSYQHISAQLHWPQVFLAMQFHCGVRFSDEAFRGLGLRLAGAEPLSAEHVVEYAAPNVKLRLDVHGEIGYIGMLGEAFLVNGLPQHAVCAFKTRHLIQASTIFSDKQEQQSALRTMPLKQVLALGHTLYKLALSEYLAKDVSAALTTARTYLSRFPRFHPVAGRMLTLLMCIEYRSGRLNNAKTYFDAAQDIYSYTLGPNHPVLGLHMSCLGDLYQGSGALSQARVMHTLACVAARRSLGASHVVTALYELKVAAAFISQQGAGGAVGPGTGTGIGTAGMGSGSGGKKLSDAKKLLQNALKVLDSTANTPSGAVYFEFETMYCLYQLAVCHMGLREVDQAGKCALRCLDSCTSRLKKLGHKLLPVIVSCMIMLCDLFLHKNDANSAQDMLDEAWLKVKQVPQAPSSQGSWSGRTLAAICRRSMEMQLSALPMSQRTLFESAAAEWMAGMQRQQQHWSEEMKQHQADVDNLLLLQRKNKKGGKKSDEEGSYDGAADIGAGGSRGGTVRRGDGEEEDKNGEDKDEEGEDEDEGEGDGAESDMELPAAPAPPAMLQQWSRACALLPSVLWRLRPRQYLALVIQGLQEEAELEQDARLKGKSTRAKDKHTAAGVGAGGGGSGRGARRRSSVSDSEVCSTAFASQAAVLNCFITQDEEGGGAHLQQVMNL